MKPEDFIHWLLERREEIQKKRLELMHNPLVHHVGTEVFQEYVGKGAQITAYNQILDYYEKHAVTQKFH